MKRLLAKNAGYLMKFSASVRDGWNSRKKVFGIGRNKTGTTSLALALTQLGYRVAPQRPAELLIEDWAVRDFRSLIRFCKRYDAFQDVPFSMEFTFQALDQAFPGSKFILTIRDSPEQWFESLIRFRTKINITNRLPTVEDLMQHPYCYKGWSWRMAQINYEVRDESNLFDRDVYIQHYVRHNERVRFYFRERPNDLLVLNPADSDAMTRLCEFLGCKEKIRAMPHANKSL